MLLDDYVAVYYGQQTHTFYKVPSYEGYTDQIFKDLHTRKIEDVGFIGSEDQYTKALGVLWLVDNEITFCERITLEEPATQGRVYLMLKDVFEYLEEMQ